MSLLDRADCQQLINELKINVSLILKKNNEIEQRKAIDNLVQLQEDEFIQGTHKEEFLSKINACQEFYLQMKFGIICINGLREEVEH